MYQRKTEEDLDCGIYVAMKVFGAKWQPCIIDAINRGAQRPSELHRAIQGPSARVIDMQLSALVQYGVVAKVIRQGFPLHVEYSLTQMGQDMLPVLVQMAKWGDRYKDLVKEGVASGSW